MVGLESTGVYDNTTRSKLEASDAPSNPEAAVIKKGDAGEKVTELQNRLILLRYMIGDASGTFDDATEAAVKEYQTTNSLEATGIVDKAMKDVLYSDKALRSPEADNLKPVSYTHLGKQRIKIIMIHSLYSLIQMPLFSFSIAVLLPISFCLL